MNIYQVKKYLKSKIGNNATIKYNLGRNKYETYKVKLQALYDNIFTVITDRNEIKSFSYNDIIMKLVRIDFKG
jgi:uncharacterized protein Veg